jgi:hypothetical protein
MAMQGHTYRLKMADNAVGEVREIEFEAASAEAALAMTERLCGDKPVQLFENGTKLANLQRSPTNDFWFVS